MHYFAGLGRTDKGDTMKALLIAVLLCVGCMPFESDVLSCRATSTGTAEIEVVTSVADYSEGSAICVLGVNEYDRLHAQIGVAYKSDDMTTAYAFRFGASLLQDDIQARFDLDGILCKRRLLSMVGLTWEQRDFESEIRYSVGIGLAF